MPKIVDRVERREEIAGAVWTLIAREGIEGLTMRKVATEAGMSIGGLPHDFATRDELITFAMTLAYERAAVGVRRVATIDPAAEALREVVHMDLPLDQEGRDECLVWLSFWSMAAISPAMTEEHSRRYGTWRSLLVTLIKKGQDEDDLDPALDAELQADILVALLDGLSVESLVEPGHITPQRCVAIIDSHLDSLRTPAAKRALAEEG